ncbi:hypothetical protein C8Q74DRAFT_1214259 [Fomes fomentarius]|nr:hypothetical protein C8Q74DRAFT_1214259 [Fomes fomentarius]
MNSAVRGSFEVSGLLINHGTARSSPSLLSPHRPNSRLRRWRTHGDGPTHDAWVDVPSYRHDHPRSLNFEVIVEPSNFVLLTVNGVGARVIGRGRGRKVVASAVSQRVLSKVDYPPQSTDIVSNNWGPGDRYDRTMTELRNEREQRLSWYEQTGKPGKPGKPGESTLRTWLVCEQANDGCKDDSIISNKTHDIEELFAVGSSESPDPRPENDVRSTYNSTWDMGGLKGVRPSTHVQAVQFFSMVEMVALQVAAPANAARAPTLRNG